MKKSELVATKEDLSKTKSLVNNVDVIKSCTRERANTMTAFSKLINLFLLRYLKKFPRSVRKLFCHNNSSKSVQSTVLVMKRTPEKHATIPFVSPGIWLSISTVMKNWQKKYPNCFPPMYRLFKTLMHRSVCMGNNSTVEDSTNTNVFPYDMKSTEM